MKLKELKRIITKLDDTPNDREIEDSLKSYFIDESGRNEYCYGDILYADANLEEILNIINNLGLEKKHFSGMYRCDVFSIKDGMYYLCKDTCFSIW